MPVARLRGPCGSGRSGLGRAFAFGGRRDIGLGRDAGGGGLLRLGAESSFGRERARAPWSSLRGAVTLGRGVVTSGRCVVPSVRKE